MRKNKTPTCKPKAILQFALLAFLIPFGYLVAQNEDEDQNDELEELSPFELTEVESVGYATSATSAGSRFNVPVVDLSHAVISVNQQLMDDVAAKSMEDSLQVVSGVNPIATGTISAVAIRGLEVRSNSSQLIDGLPGGSSILFGAGAEQEIEFLERFEVVKGAAGTLYGSHSMGGLVNRIYKVPKAEFSHSIDVSYTNIKGEDTYQVVGDTTGPIDPEGQLKYRLVGIYRDGNTLNGAADDKEGFYGTLSYTPTGSDSNVWVRLERREIDTGHETPSVFFDNEGRPSFDIMPVDIRTVPVPNNERRKIQQGEFGISNSLGDGLLGNWDMRLVARWFKLKNDEPTPDIIPLGFAFLDADNNIVGTSGTAVPEDGGQAFADNNFTDIVLSNSVSRINGEDVTKQWGVYLDMTGSFDTGPLSHRALIYTHFTDQRGTTGFTNVTFREEFGGSQFTDNFVPENAFSVLRQEPLLPESDEFFTDPDPLATQNNKLGGEIFGFGIQDNIRFLDDRVLAALGTRFSSVQNDGIENLVTGDSSPAFRQNEWIFKAGVVVKPLPQTRNVSLFFNFSETFDPIFEERVEGSGELLDNLLGEATEVGIKLQMFNSALVFTGSYFDNELEAQPIRLFNPETGRDEFEQGGTSTIDGFEFDLAWQVNENIGILLAASEVDSLDPNGNFIRGIQNKFNYDFVGRYQFLEGPLSGLTTGVMVNKTSDRIGSNRQDFTLDGYTTVNAFARYKWKNIRFQFNVNNIGDKEASLSPIFSALVIAANPRNYNFSVGYDF